MRHADPNPLDFELVDGRDVAALQDPRPAVLVGARSDAGEICFATVIWVTPVSHNPAMVAFALRAKSHTMGIIRATGRFSLAVPPADAEGVRLVEFCGGNTGRLVDKGAAVAHALVSASPAAPSDDGGNAEGGKAETDTAAAARSTFAPAAPGEAAAEDTGRTDLVPVPLHSYSWEVGVIESIQEAGDHLLAVGTITRAGTRAPRDERGQLTPYDSLLCVQHGAYAAAQRL
ncbi:MULTISPECIES: flavin reductase family protein [unclassified Adlercreutzia]|uniref:flavin reductase family protein n=1 Tax=unclassified Adlercreutzia TaxID=2636013 RepID=UPI0013EDF3F7|nr:MULTISPECIES: flavin reductase [unclassified Adlercreutzia]